MKLDTYRHLPLDIKPIEPVVIDMKSQHIAYYAMKAWKNTDGSELSVYQRAGNEAHQRVWSYLKHWTNIHKRLWAKQDAAHARKIGKLRKRKRIRR